MKAIHWIIFAVAFWLTLAPFVAGKILSAVALVPEGANSIPSLLNVLQLNNFIAGLVIVVLSLVAISTEAVTERSEATRAMHWIALGIAVWLTVAPFALNFTLETFSWNNLLLGIMVGIYSLIQLNVEKA
ncbi:MAG: hypothetical protein AAB865_00245 [Patescibacteria group bacterium]